MFLVTNANMGLCLYILSRKHHTNRGSHYSTRKIHCSSPIFFILAQNIFLCLHKGCFTYIVLLCANFIPNRPIQYLVSNSNFQLILENINFEFIYVGYSGKLWTNLKYIFFFISTILITRLLSP